ncbi:MAG: PaaI family thioesterase [Kiloniellales bacterium]|nr:PaaI family thioesterase [Kiloniellales bacterium]
MNDPLYRRGAFADLIGYELATWRADYAEVTLAVTEKHMNRSGVLHGGVLTTLLDSVCGYAGTYCAAPGRVRRAFTLSLNSHFVGTVEAGARLTAVGRKTGGGQRIFFSRAEVHDQDGRLIGQGEGVFRYRGASGDPKGMPI